MKEFNVVMMGAGGVGKSAITIRFVTGTFMEHNDPTIEDFYKKIIEVDGSPFMLEILDTAGTEQFSSMRDLYIKNGNGFILVYSVINKQTFQDVCTLREHILRAKNSEHVPMVLVGNKVDLADQMREVPFHMVDQLASDHNFSFFETSAKTRHNIDFVFKEIVQQMLMYSLNTRNNHSNCCFIL